MPSTGACVATLTGHDDSVTHCDISPDDKMILSSSLDSTVRVWSFNAGFCLRIFRNSSDWVHVVKYQPSGQGILAGTTVRGAGEDGAWRRKTAERWALAGA